MCNCALHSVQLSDIEPSNLVSPGRQTGEQLPRERHTFKVLLYKRLNRNLNNELAFGYIAKSHRFKTRIWFTVPYSPQMLGTPHRAKSSVFF